MSTPARSALTLRSSSLAFITSNPIRRMGTTAAPECKEGDISSVFVSLSGITPDPLPERFADIKRHLIEGNESQLTTSWRRLLEKLVVENEIVKQRGPDIIPQIQFKDLKHAPEAFVNESKKRGVAVIKGVVPKDEARGYKNEVEDYVRRNPSTKGFPQDNPQVFELYWSPPQIKARGHPNMLETQRFLMNMWHSKDKKALISTSQPLTYADRLRIRQPGDSKFALGPHVDGGSVERWEPTGYGLGGVYNKIFQGNWEEFDPWESSARVPAVTDLYQGSGSCSMFRMFQGWLGLSHTAPGEGTLKVNPLLPLATAYFMLRPFFEPLSPPTTRLMGSQFLHPDNWVLKPGAEMNTALHGASPGHGQELNDALHPHLDLENSMVHVPKISPGDYVAWHCDTIHAVDKSHAGKGDSSVMYIPVCPTTELNATYVARQRDTFLSGQPAPDFPGGKGESAHIGRPTAKFIAENTKEEGLQSMGLAMLKKAAWEDSAGAKDVIHTANRILGFDWHFHRPVHSFRNISQRRCVRM